eukprot:6174177-Pleurochrysis_carterae.AAC.2
MPAISVPAARPVSSSDSSPSSTQMDVCALPDAFAAAAPPEARKTARAQPEQCTGMRTATERGREWR